MNKPSLVIASLCVMLIDDNPDDNFFHEREIKKSTLVNSIVTKESGEKALDHLMAKRSNTRHPDLIFLDINMPGMNGWEFLERYKSLSAELQSKAIVVMLTTSDNLSDQEKANSYVTEFRTKPLTLQMLEEVIAQYWG